MEEALGPFHVPQHSRRVKLRITPPTTDLHTYLFPSSSSSAADPPQHLHLSGTASGIHGGDINAMTAALPDRISDAGFRNSSSTGLNLSLATTHGRAVQQQTSGGGQRSGRSAPPLAVATTPVGPFTGYASILSRSRFLRPAEELLEDFCGANRGGVSDLGADKARVLEASVGENWSQKIADRCEDSNLLSMLQEVYKRYKLYHQQMQSAVSSFEAVAGLANAAPFICFAIKAVSKHFHCLKKAILDYINSTSTGSGSDDFRNGRDSSGLFSVERSHRHEQRPQHQLQYRGSMQHPVWRSQRGFPEKAVAVLRTWLFENFLHPYPTDTDKEMLARRTGLSRSQVSNWFTNARVRLWKPMVEEIHSLEKQSHYPSESDHQKFVNVLADHFSSASHPHPPEKDSHNSQALIPRVAGHVSQMQPDLACSILSSNHHLVGPSKSDADKHSSSSAYGPSEETTLGIPWSSCGQAVPFWLAK